MSSEVLVCQSNSCRRAGAAAVLRDIEELTAEVSSECRVRRSGCLGYCRRGPAAIVVKQHSRTGRSSETTHTRLQSAEARVRLVQSATGQLPPSKAPALPERPETSRSNTATAASKRSAAAKIDADKRPSLWRNFLKASAANSRSGGAAGSVGADASTRGVAHAKSLPTVLERYSQWTVDMVVPVTAHSAVFSFSSTDVKRGSPHRRGRFRMPEPKTWHTTLVALVGENKESPLPLVERDYTPISSAKDWENGRCEILIKIYPDGLATSWLHRLCCEDAVSVSASARPKVWLSPPIKTLSVPTMSENPDAAFRPASVLLLLAGTGVVALPQILAHRDPLGQLGIATRAADQMRIHIDVVLSYRRDDVLMLPEIVQWCASHTLPFPTMAGGSIDHLLTDFQAMPNCQLVQGERLHVSKLDAMVSNMPQPCRFVVSGPKEFNSAVREILLELRVEDNAVTILPA